MNPAPAPFTLRDADASELVAVGELTAEAYRVSGEYTGPFSEAYSAELRDAASRASAAELVVAVDLADATLLGSVTLARRGSPYAHIARPDEAELRMLGVDARARGRGVGTALVEESAFRAGLDGAAALVISVFDRNAPAARMYDRAGFVRCPDRDWVPEPGIRLLVSRRPLHCARCGDLRDAGDHEPCDAALALEPPRFCPACRRRLTVQVTPAGYRAACSRHGRTGT